MNNETIKKMKSMNTKTIVAVALILAVLGAGYALARPESGDSWGSMMGSYGIWNGMMGGHRDMMDYSNGTTAGYSGMMDGNGPANGMMDYDKGNDHCGTDGGYAGSGYGANITP